MKSKFKVTLDRKFTIWHRTSAIVEADSLEEAQNKLLEHDVNGKHAEIASSNVNTEYLLETVEYMTASENDGQPVLEFVPELNYEIPNNQLKENT